MSGAALGLASNPARRDTHHAALTVALMFGALALLPAGLALYILFPDWSLMYTAQPVHASLLMTGALLSVAFVMTPMAGCFAVRSLGPSNRGRRWGWLLLTLGGAVLAGLVTLGWQRLTTVAYYEAFHYGGFRLALVESALFFPLIVFAASLAGVYVFSLLHLRRSLG